MASKIPILFLHSQDGYGADSAIHAHLMRHLDRDRFEVHCASSKGDGRGEPAALAQFRRIPDVRVRPTTFAPGFRHRSREQVLRGARSAIAFPIDFAALAAYVKRHGIRILHSTDRPRDAVYCVAMGKLTGAKSIVHVHVAWSEWYSAPAKWGVRNADGVFSISRFVTETIVKTGTPRERVHTVLNGIDLAGWDPALVDGRAVRRELGVPDGAPLLASVSRLFRAKGQGELLDAFAIVLKKHPDARLLIVGADAIEVHGGSFTAELKEQAQRLGVTERVVFTGPRSDIPRIMAACDVFTLPSVEEPFGLVYLEAMAMKRPVISLDDGGTPEVVVHGETGLLSPAKDVAALAANIDRLVASPEERARMGERGRARVLAQFGAARMARDAGDAYEAILERS